MLDGGLTNDQVKLAKHTHWEQQDNGLLREGGEEEVMKKLPGAGCGSDGQVCGVLPPNSYTRRQT